MLIIPLSERLDFINILLNSREISIFSYLKLKYCSKSQLLRAKFHRLILSFKIIARWSSFESSKKRLLIVSIAPVFQLFYYLLSFDVLLPSDSYTIYSIQFSDMVSIRNLH